MESHSPQSWFPNRVWIARIWLYWYSEILHLSSPSYTYHSWAATRFITPLYHPSPVMNCSSLLGLLEPRLGQKTLKAWSKQIASMLSDGSVPVLITSLPISLSEAPSQCAHLSSPLLCLQVLHLSFLPCWNIWAAPSLLTVHFIETTKALRNRL